MQRGVAVTMVTTHGSCTPKRKHVTQSTVGSKFENVAVCLQMNTNRNNDEGCKLRPRPESTTFALTLAQLYVAVSMFCNNFMFNAKYVLFAVHVYNQRYRAVVVVLGG